MPQVDHQAQTDIIDHTNPLTTEQKAAARRTVASFSNDADECREFFAMLGIAAEQEREQCQEMTIPKLPKDPSQNSGKSGAAPSSSPSTTSMRATPRRRKPSFRNASRPVR